MGTQKTVLRTVRSVEEFASLQTRWEQLTCEPLHSFGWHFAWWNNFQHLGQLNLFVLEADDQVVGIAPFFQDRWNGQKRLRFLGSGKTCTDYADLIVADPWREQFTIEIAKAVASSAAMLEMEGVDGSRPQDAFDKPLGNQFWRYDTELDPTWQLSLPSDWAGFIASSKKSLKRKIKKAVKRLDSTEFEVRSSFADLPFEDAWEHIVALHQSRFESKGEPGAFADDNFRNFLHDAAVALGEKRQAEIIVAFHEEQPIGAHLVLHSPGITQLYLAGILAEKSKLEPGHLLITFAVRRAIEQGCEVFDFLRGDQPYKPYWGAVPNQLNSIRFVSRSTLPTLLNQGFRFLREVKHQLVAVKSMNLWSAT
ncbi:GNAT family N-acetyltransferase [Mariniblastus fucicola]|uniref:N-acetyltransferase domain-containing protein n=1 Tax=Mariniblastus fucicola TaxID=980251 RepID=A0A5B9P4J1_9BACT|nr:GNAT family N-acetyltransferase [Mariniblastus fucicola]QEG21194.1 hypothetical protein MFFC18_10490 [Mariniblastus fucicola]